MILNEESFFDTVHGRYGCIVCHGGVSGVDDKEAAHEVAETFRPGPERPADEPS